VADPSAETSTVGHDLIETSRPANLQCHPKASHVLGQFENSSVFPSKSNQAEKSSLETIFDRT
jgi:hypothetical protein